MLGPIAEGFIITADYLLRALILYWIFAYAREQKDSPILGNIIDFTKEAVMFAIVACMVAFFAYAMHDETYCAGDSDPVYGGCDYYETIDGAENITEADRIQVGAATFFFVWAPYVYGMYWRRRDGKPKKTN